MSFLSKEKKKEGGEGGQNHWMYNHVLGMQCWAKNHMYDIKGIETEKPHLWWIVVPYCIWSNNILKAMLCCLVFVCWGPWGHGLKASCCISVLLYYICLTNILISSSTPHTVTNILYKLCQIHKDEYKKIFPHVLATTIVRVFCPVSVYNFVHSHTAASEGQWTEADYRLWSANTQELLTAGSR